MDGDNLVILIMIMTMMKMIVMVMIIKMIMTTMMIVVSVARLKFYESPNRGSKNPNIHYFQKQNSHSSATSNDIIYPDQLLL